MKTRIAVFSALCFLAFCVPVGAHPGHESTVGYLAFWRGVVPKSGAAFTARAASPEFWRTAFVSKYRLVGEQLPALSP